MDTKQRSLFLLLQAEDANESYVGGSQEFAEGERREAESPGDETACLTVSKESPNQRFHRGKRKEVKAKHSRKEGVMGLGNLRKIQGEIFMLSTS